MTTTIAEATTGAACGGSQREAPPEEHDERAEVTLDSDELFHLLQSERRRRAIRYLLATDAEPISMRDVAEAVAAEEYDTTIATLASEERQRVYISLYQSHLPQLEDAGVITYDKDRSEITTTPLIDGFERYLSERSPADVDSERPVWRALAGLGLGTLLTLVLVSVLGTGPTLGITLLLLAAGMAIEVGLANGAEMGFSWRSP